MNEEQLQNMAKQAAGWVLANTEVKGGATIEWYVLHQDNTLSWLDRFGEKYDAITSTICHMLDLGIVPDNTPSYVSETWFAAVQRSKFTEESPHWSLDEELLYGLFGDVTSTLAGGHRWALGLKRLGQNMPLGDSIEAAEEEYVNDVAADLLSQLDD